MARGMGFDAPAAAADRAGDAGLCLRAARRPSRPRLAVERATGDRGALHPLRARARLLLRG